MTTIAFGQRKCHGTMADSTIFTIQNGEHIDWIGIDFFDEYLIVAIIAIQPFGMWLVGKQDERHFTGFFHHNVQIDNLDSGFRKNIGSRLDILFAQGPDPGYLVTDAIPG